MRDASSVSRAEENHPAQIASPERGSAVLRRRSRDRRGGHRDLKQFIGDEQASAAQIIAIGAFSRAILAFFNWDSKDYLRKGFDQQVEVASLIGDVALSPDGEPTLHIHVVLGQRDCSALTGHFFEVEIRPTLEAIISKSPAHLRKRTNSASGLALIRTSGSH